MNIDLRYKTALVCGSTQGIGKASALELAKLGANVVLLARNKEKLESVLAELPNVHSAQKHSFLCADFSKIESLRSTLEHFEGAHILVNNTGGPAPGLAVDASEQAFLEAFSAHLLCNQLLVQKVVPFMKQEQYGRIVNIISTSVKQPLKNLGVSNTIRAAVANWAKTLSFELASFGITVNNVLPGATATERLHTIISNKSRKTGVSREDAAAEMLAEIPAGRFAEAEEIANAVAFLCSPSAAYITGINLPVDGGRLGCL